MSGTFHATFHSEMYLYYNKLYFCYKGTGKLSSTSNRKYHMGGIFDGCVFDFQMIGMSAYVMTYPWRERAVSMLSESRRSDAPAKSASTYTSKPLDGSGAYMIP